MDESEEFQYVLFVPAKVSPKSVPPTATSYGLDARPFTVMPCVAAEAPWSHMAAPSSPDATNTETPSLTACWYAELNAALAEEPFSTSQAA